METLDIHDRNVMYLRVYALQPLCCTRSSTKDQIKTNLDEERSGLFGHHVRELRICLPRLRDDLQARYSCHRTVKASVAVSANAISLCRRLYVAANLYASI
jgi:hypothetical protein